MGVDVSINLILGYRVKGDKVVKDIIIEKSSCNHNKKGFNYCPVCGEPNQVRKVYDRKCLLKGLENDEDFRDFLYNSKYIHCPLSNCSLEGEDNDYIVGIKILEKDEMYDAGIEKLDLKDKKYVDNFIKQFVEKYQVEYDKDSFGLYLIQNAY